MRTDAHSAAAPTRFVAGETPCVCCAERAAREGECGIYCCTCAKLNGGACCEAAVAEEAAREADGRDTGLYCDDCGKTLTRHEGVEGALEDRWRVTQWHCRNCRTVVSTETIRRVASPLRTVRAEFDVAY